LITGVIVNVTRRPFAAPPGMNKATMAELAELLHVSWATVYRVPERAHAPPLAERPVPSLAKSLLTERRRPTT
jgi:hypothetical protein